MSLSKTSSSNAASVFIRNLDKAIDHKALHDIFSTFGSIRRCEVVRNKAGISKEYGFVHYTNVESASACISALNGIVLIEKQISVERVMSREERQRTALLCNVHVKNFGNELTNDSLKTMFQKYGNITSHRIVKGKDGKSRGHGFVVFTTPASAENAIRELNGKRLNSGKLLEVGLALKTATPGIGMDAQLNTEYNRGVNLYVSNLDRSINADNLRDKFAAFGIIRSIKIVFNENHSDGFGFVRFSSAEEAIKAISEMNGQKLEGTNKTLRVSLAQCQGDRQATSQCLQRMADLILQNSIGRHLQSAGQGGYYFLPVSQQPQPFFGAFPNHLLAGPHANISPGAVSTPTTVALAAAIDVANKKMQMKKACFKK
ncbi:polyadenylate-binding protein 1A-like [Topomyia yanbarensis]|uniref:polyadenylate-binding protein 1A-like n=1 Tax=Topomyia yanbarensis TaxID=2498891 RepID=UPI00273B5845|nr:polyadenylate-binding protein 1A-like [Topomyia yanbarensis]